MDLRVLSDPNPDPAGSGSGSGSDSKFLLLSDLGPGPYVDITSEPICI
jgi:hypothetical protein